MNQSKLLIGEFEASPSGNIQTIDNQYFHFENLFHIAWNAPGGQTYLLPASDPESVFRLLCSQIRVVRAAGGWVTDPLGAGLFIHRLGKWDLPKGKAEQGEDSAQTALREVQEECGILPALRSHQPYTSYHSYSIDGEVVIKPTDWYAMKPLEDTPLIPQLEEDITEARWVSPEQRAGILENTYPLIRDVIKYFEQHEH